MLSERSKEMSRVSKRSQGVAGLGLILFSFDTHGGELLASPIAKMMMIRIMVAVERHFMSASLS